MFSTPCWNATSPLEHSGSRNEERPGQWDEGQSRTLHIRQRLQFSDTSTPLLPRQQHKSMPHRHPSDQSESFSTPLAAFPWERDDSKPAARRQSPSSPQAPCANVISQVHSERGVCGTEKDHRMETDISLSEMRRCVSSLEEELSVKAGMLKSLQKEIEQSKKELAAKELSLQRAHNEISQGHTRMAQERERVSGAEQKLKQLQEELKCQRQNAESSRLQHQQRTKELEKEHQKELMEFQKERQCLERQHQQEMNKLNQELQQARVLHNALQAQADKLSLQKQALEKELDTLKGKLKWTDGQLQESLKKEAQTQAKLTQAVREMEGVAVNLEQSRKRERALEEEGRRLAEERDDALRLLTELQEEKAAPPLQPVQFCPVVQSYTPQPSYSLHSRPSTRTKTPTAATRAEWKGEEDVNEGRVEIAASYPADREPGEGIDSEHITALISQDSECLQKGEHRKRSNEKKNKCRNEATECDSSGTNKRPTFDHVLSISSHSAAGTVINTSVDGDHCSLMLSGEEISSLKLEQANTAEDLKRENATLRSELHEVHEELQKRLEDLEAQRLAEADTRTRLKQLSCKHASQAVEKEEQDKKFRVQLESEKAETERLRKAMAALETEMKRGREEKEKEREEQQEEKNKALEDRESEMIELNIQLKRQLAEVKAQLALEREERKREEEEKNQINTDMDIKKELSIKVAELKAELEELKQSRKEYSLEKVNLSLANSPLTYLTLHDDELNSNFIRCDNKLLPLPEQQHLLCQCTNQRNMLASQATAELIKEQPTVTDPECSPLSDEGQTGQMASPLKGQIAPQSNLGGSSLSDYREALSDPQKGELAPSDLAKEVERLQKENAKEKEHAAQYQVKLGALQTQVTRQTQQLTIAFEKQSQHISGLLAELQEKESALLSQGEELQYLKRELEALKTTNEREERKRTEETTVKEEESDKHKEETRDDRLEGISGLQPNQAEDCAVSQTDCDSNPQTNADQPKFVTSDAETPVSMEVDNETVLIGEEHLGSDKTRSIHDSPRVMGESKCNQDGGTADVVAELLTLQQENQLLKQKIEALTVSDSRNPALQTDSEIPEVSVKQSQNTGNGPLSSLTEQRTPSVLNDLITEEQEYLQQNEGRMEDGVLERADKKTAKAEEELVEVSQLRINHLEQQVAALQKKVWALSEETKQQSEELGVWRLASQPAPTFDHILPYTDNQSKAQEQVSAFKQFQSNQQHTGDMNPTLAGSHGQAQAITAQVHASTSGPQESLGNVTIVREDELFLSCSSNKLQGHMLFSRLQHSCLPEPKTLHRSKKMSALNEYNQDTAKIDKESEKENQDISFVQWSHACPSQYKEKRDTELIPSLDKMGQEYVTKDLHEVSGPNETKATESNPQANPNPSRSSSQINTDFRMEMKSASSQTEESFYLHSVPAAHELHSAYTQTEEHEEGEELVDFCPAPLSEEAESGDKMLFSGSFPIPADPARLAERIRRNRTQLSAAFDDTEYEPYGLPEVVMKGFADIPSGPSCPYIVRRGLLGTTIVPVPQKDQGQEEETD
uniref:centromere protein F isoform X1 n=1 Tax=Monopterus albus TaxID=43700 RepID=UPI0009B46235|nr:centromere protein F-like isoform X1 [Monopterus albus]XP_020451384.1 centromere protein F-like isoform X1 [Monopterus albus]XP_020451394.1 centromere protein F-like isoform X1 [Monopterus albus]XP_020451403.1 centromere protein F-like isoform X1 [Monopterus albus]XP_020451412.1 centromere protein F-like isoform X1 [Monopterus albus]XP_020451421.1 centromere protein F-like isoform X1 [Monopterus albus]